MMEGGLLAMLLRTTVWLALLAAIFVTLERLFPRRAGEIFRAGFWADLGYFFLSSLVPGLLFGAPLALLTVAAEMLLPGWTRSWADHLPFWARFGASLVVGEIGFYWGHRLMHTVPFLWRFHAVHHSAERVDWLVNTRAHPFDLLFNRLCGLALLVIFGLAGPMSAGGTIMPALLIVATTFWGFFIHANLRWRFGWLESVLSTPAFHHWHHTRSEYRDRNYASIFPWMDRLFGTFHLPAAWPLAYGTDTEVGATLPEQLVRPFLPERGARLKRDIAAD